MSERVIHVAVCGQGCRSKGKGCTPLLAEALYLVRYIEKAGSGTQRIIELCAQAGLPVPTFEVRNGSFVLTLWRDWLTSDVLATLNLNERQLLVVAHLKRKKQITNAEYQHLTGAIQRTSARDLMELVRKGLVIKDRPHRTKCSLRSEPETRRKQDKHDQWLNRTLTRQARHSG